MGVAMTSKSSEAIHSSKGFALKRKEAGKAIPGK
jgi:hypothetical protein